jgi:hypothetical protein
VLQKENPAGTAGVPWGTADHRADVRETWQKGVDPLFRGVARPETWRVACHNRFDHKGAEFPQSVGTAFVLPQKATAHREEEFQFTAKVRMWKEESELARKER